MAELKSANHPRGLPMLATSAAIVTGYLRASQTQRSTVLMQKASGGTLQMEVEKEQIIVNWRPTDHNISGQWIKLGRRLIPMLRSDSGEFCARFTTGAGLKFIRLQYHDNTNRVQTPACALIRIIAPAKPPSSHRTDTPERRKPVTVSVIVPNYNHAAYLRQRLDSIYGQTYPHIEVILLDDCSSDKSVQVLTEYQDRYPGKTRLVANTQNSGGPFRQWARGIQLARGELIWIAESDDWCDPNFLHTLVLLFDRPDVLLAHALTRFVDENGNPTDTSYDRYVRTLSPGKWKHDHVSPAREEVRIGLGIRNTIPNASAALFRRPTDLPLLNDETWLSMRTCGDWVFYLHRLRGGSIAFTRRTNNYYRNHSSNTSLPAQSRADYYREHETVARITQELYAPPAKVIERMDAVLQKRYAKSREPLPSYTDLFSCERIQRTAGEHRLHVLICSHGFVPGGAEGFPISLAVHLRAMGCTVTFADFEGGMEDAGIRAKLPLDIPVIYPNRESPRSAARYWLKIGIDVVSTHHWRADLFCAKALDTLPRTQRPAMGCTHHGFYHLDAANLLHHRDLFARTVSTWIHVATTGTRPFTCLSIDPVATGSLVTHIPAGIPLPTTEPLLRSELNIPENTFALCLASRAIQDKGWRTAIEAVAIARAQTGHPIQLLLAGNGPVYEELLGEQRPDWVCLLGHRNDIPRIYAAVDLGLLPSTYPAESCPLTLIECLAVGTPVLATDIGDIKAMLTAPDGTMSGSVIPTHPDKSLATRLASAICTSLAGRNQSPKSQNTAKAAARRYDIIECTAAYLRCFKEAASRRNR